MGAATNLHPALQEFVGRGREIEHLRRLVDDERLVSLIGTAGVGKTRLALELMRQLVAADGGWRGVWFCDFTEARSAMDLCREVARVLDVPLQSGGVAAAVDALGDAMAGRGRELVVLDNCEQVADHLPDTLGRWLERTRDTRFLATSRERLRLRGEACMELGALPMAERGETDVAAIAASEAVALFVARARRVVAEFELDAGNAGAIHRIVHTLDGLPLAIELAAARVGVLAPAALLDRLRRRFEVLASHSRQVVGRHRTLRAAIDWSWELLEPWERAGLAQLSAFRGGFTIDAADQVVRVQSYANAPDVIGGLQWLRDRSLVWVDASRQDAEHRFGLYLSVRDYAAEKLAELGIEADTFARHARYFAARVSDLWRRPFASDVARVIVDEEENLLAAFARCLAGGADDAELLAPGVECLLALEAARAVRGPWADYADHLSMAIDAAAFAELPAALVARAYQARGRMRALRGQLDHATADFERALEWAADLDDGSIAGSVLLRLGNVANREGRYADAGELYDDALARMRAAGDRYGEGQALGNLAVIDGQVGRYADARRRFGEAQAIYAEVGDRQLRARTLGNLAGLLQDEGKLDEADLYFRQAIDELRAIGDRRDAAVFAGARGILAHERADWDTARRCYTEAVEVLRDIGDRTYEALFTVHLAAVLAACDELDSATRRMTEAEALWAVAPPGPEQALALYRSHLELALARSAEASGDAAAAAVRRRVVVERVAAVRRAHGASAPPQLVRMALRLLEGALEPSTDGAGSPEVLVVGPEGRWFEAPGGDRVDLSRRQTMRRLLVRLAEHRRDAPDQGLTTEEMFRAGWPGERVARSAAANRVRVAVTTLRKLGLRDLLLTRGDGYLFDPELAIELVDV